MKVSKMPNSKSTVSKYLDCVRTHKVRSNITYGKVGIFCDADHDGQGGITPLLILFFYRWPELFVQEIITIVKSPMYIFTKNRGKANEDLVYCYDKEQYEAVRDKYKSYECRYIKGLGSLRRNEYKAVIDNTDQWQVVTIDDDDCFRVMFSDDVNARRRIMGYEGEENESDQ